MYEEDNKKTKGKDDLNNNGIPDKKEHDLNGNGIDDKLENKVKIPYTDLAKIGITKEQLEKRPEDLKALLDGNITKSFSIDKFKDLDIKARLQLERKQSKEPQLIVFPDKMEIKQSKNRSLEKESKQDKEKSIKFKSKQESRGYSKTASR